ncbi:helicase HerA domain-containing protein [Xylanimonas ulmi]|nr:DUF87 domain-containing protein [Xylanibacterium ulmi]
MDFHEAIVLTHDKWKHDVAGIPQFSLLLATARDISSEGFDDDEVLLLRVEGSAPLSLESDLLAVREESLRTALSQYDSPSPAVVLDMGLDPFTKNRVSFTGLRCRVLGTFYESIVDGTTRLEFGADVDNFYATSTYRVLKPVGKGLSAVASYIKPAPTKEPVDMVRIGTVRYSSTRRRAQAAGQDDAAVQVNIHDFIGNKTGMFGMTRMGKSNTMKTVVARTQVISQLAVKAGGRPIGQLILDPQGEYANPNQQDGTEIAAIGEDRVVIYRFGGAANASNVRPLGINFFDPGQLDVAKGFVSSSLSESGADYVRAFVNADFAGTPRPGESTKEGYERAARADRGRLMLYGALAKADFMIPTKDPVDTQYPWRAWVSMKDPVADAIERDLPGALFRPARKGRVGVNRDHLVDVCQWFVDRAADGSMVNTDGFNSFVDGDPYKSALPIFSQMNGNRSVSGYTKLKPLAPFHHPDSKSDFRDQIFDDLVDGKIVIVDLHLGPLAVTRRMSEGIASRLMERQTETFTKGVEPPRIQVVLEEAHNLFSNRQFTDELDVWVRMAKESSKLKIGLIYATQEVSGVAHEVLANTKNWVVAHLNNTKELRNLGQFYDFEAFAEAIISQEDRGYVRLKTMSSPYIVPVQIDPYGLELVNEARAAANDPALVPTSAA